MGRSWYVYMVRCSDGSLYTGIALSLSKRIEQHNLGRGAVYTRPRRPVHLVYSEYGWNRSGALKREHLIRHLNKADKEKMVDEWLTENKTRTGK